MHELPSLALGVSHTQSNMPGNHTERRLTQQSLQTQTVLIDQARPGAHWSLPAVVSEALCRLYSTAVHRENTKTLV